MQILQSLTKRLHLSPAPEHLAGRVRVEQVDALARMGSTIAIVGFMSAWVISVSTWGPQTKSYLIGFLSVFSFFFALGVRRSHKWRSNPKPLTLDRRAFLIRNLHVGVFGLIWATAPAFLMRNVDPHQQLIIAYVSSGVTASAVVISPTIMAAILMGAPIVVSTIISFLLWGGPSGPTLAIIVVLFSSLLMLSIVQNYRVFVSRTVSLLTQDEQAHVITLLLRDFEENSSDWLWRTDGQHRLTQVSERMAAVAQRPASQLAGLHVHDWLASIAAGEPESRPALERLSAEMAAWRSFKDLVVPVRLKGKLRWWKFTGRVERDANGQLCGYRGVAGDVTAAHETQAQILHMARHDSLTGLPNRGYFQDVLADCVREGRPATLLWLDLDKFKGVNDTLGHDVGDALLCAVAERLRAAVGPGHAIARLGGDEFAVLQRGADPAGAPALARRILEQVSAPYYIGEARIGVGASIGIARFPTDAHSPEELLKCADLALYRSKADGRGVWRVYEAEMDVRAQERSKLQGDLRHALERGELDLAFQPVVDVATRTVPTVEALLRWTHPERGDVSPAVFVPLAEEIGAISAIGEWALRRACETAAAWPAPTRVAVNLSPVQFRDPGLMDSIEAALADSGLPGDRLELELTESILLEATDSTLAGLHRLRRGGVSVALDDFGTGYSSLSYLRSFPFDKVKIDKAFVRDLGRDQGSLAIVRAIIAMVQSLDMTVTAEGVETEEQLAMLRLHGCTRMQGFLFSRAVKAPKLAEFLAEPFRWEDEVAPARAAPLRLVDGGAARAV